jgi:hypothetical protein
MYAVIRGTCFDLGLTTFCCYKTNKLSIANSTQMKKMLGVTSVALFFLMMSLPGSLNAQTFTHNPEGFRVSGPMLIVASVVVILKVSFLLSLFIHKRRGGSH